MISDDFYGKKGFVWWTGIVQNSKDPLGTGSVRVRIIGLHPFEDETGLPDESLVPEEKLPWAQVLLAPNAAMTTSNLREGDWVFGFFQDGEQAQIPVVMGMYPGFQSKQSQIVYEQSERIQTNPPNVPETVVIRKEGEQTTSRTARGELEGTQIEKSNKELAHVCDVSNSVNKIVGEVKIVIGTVFRAIKEAVRALLVSLAGDPSGEIRKLFEFVKSINTAIKEVLEFYEEEIKPYIDGIIKIARNIRAMIDYILSLPDRLIAFLSECIAQFTASIAAGFSDLTTSLAADLDLGIDFTEVGKELATLRERSGQIFDAAVNIVSVPAQFANAILTPADPSAVDGISKSVDKFISDTYPSPEKQVETSSFSGTKGI
jgi:hypothetical protein